MVESNRKKQDLLGQEEQVSVRNPVTIISLNDISLHDLPPKEVPATPSESEKSQSTNSTTLSEPKPRRWTQILSLLPVYLLQINYGMNSGYPAIVTPQLGEPCSEFQITMNQESWIGELSFLSRGNKSGNFSLLQ